MTFFNLKVFSDAKMCHQKPNMSKKLSTLFKLLSMVKPSALTRCIAKNLHPHITHHLPHLSRIRITHLTQ
ncbi:hypothetical protein HanPI659440_Chr08g0286781 [Helianthus annuus]|nr:hypothetical protein HanPI659440_Chr08g0286781 [Helianthus annuus]